jgi:flavin-dependent dehydrogenase
MIDLVVAGGGPIGLAAAIEARMAGLSGVVVEPRPSPIDKACGEGLMPGAIAALQRLGVDPPGHPLAGISYRAGGRRADHPFRNGPGRGVRRTALHAVLATRAGELGVEVVVGRVAGVEQGDDSVTVRMAGAGSPGAGAGSLGARAARGVGVGIRARWMLGADGLHSTVRELVGLATAPAARLTTRPAIRPATPAEPAGAHGRSRRFGLRRHFAVTPWSDFVEVHWTPVLEHGPAEVYVTPVGGPDGGPGSEVGVAVLGPQLTDYEEAIRSVPALAERLEGAETTSAVRGAGPLRQRTRARTAGRVLLVGDASGYVDALTGEGIRVGLAQAAAAIRCLTAGDPARYEREWRWATRDYRMLTSGLVALGDSPLRRAIVPTACALPGVYGAIVERLAR